MALQPPPPPLLHLHPPLLVELLASWGFQVGRGVTVRADIRVPFGTVAVTRGGELRGSVFAREFLLEDGEGDPREPMKSAGGVDWGRQAGASPSLFRRVTG